MLGTSVSSRRCRDRGLSVPNREVVGMTIRVAPATITGRVYDDQGSPVSDQKLRRRISFVLLNMPRYFLRYLRHDRRHPRPVIREEPAGSRARVCRRCFLISSAGIIWSLDAGRTYYSTGRHCCFTCVRLAENALDNLCRAARLQLRAIAQRSHRTRPPDSTTNCAGGARRDRWPVDWHAAPHRCC